MKLKRPRLVKFSLRSFLAVVTLICLGFAYHIVLTRNQSEVVRAIEKSGGDVIYEHEFDPIQMYITPANSSWVPEFAVQLLGKDFFYSVVAVTWSRSVGEEEVTVTDADLKLITNLPQIIAVGVEGSHVTATGIAVLRGLPKLQWLWVDLPVTRPVMEELKKFSELKTLTIFTSGSSKEFQELRSALPNTKLNWSVAESEYESEQQGRVKVPIN